MSEPTFRELALKLLDRDGIRDDSVWSIEVPPMIMTYLDGRFMVSIPGPERDPDARVPIYLRGEILCSEQELNHYKRVLERRLILERLADV
jgi:hypothetical protein